MYRVLLADDEPIILSGLQSMLRWEEHDCTVVGSARNGEQTLELIGQSRPDVVICDINMPLLTGLEVLRRCAEEDDGPVFIMLTNYEDFEMAREAMRNHAVDYLLKIDLDEEKLVNSIKRAVQECERRGRMGQETAPAEDVSPADIIRKYAARLLDQTADDLELAAAGLEKRDAADRCMAVELMMDPYNIPNIESFSAEDKTRLFQFHLQLVEDLAQKLFYKVGCVLVPKEAGAWLYLWKMEDAALLERFLEKLSSTLGEISQMQISLLATEIVPREGLTELRGQLAALNTEYQISPARFLRYSRLTARTDYAEAAKRYVESHILERVTVQDVADAIGITPNYLSSIFKRQLGQNFIDYVNASKIRHACTLLRGNQNLVYEVSHMLGYDNAYYFTKVFKKYMKMTPSEFQVRAGQHEDAT